MSAVEWLATALGIACVALAAGRSVLTFPVGIAAVSLLGVVVWEARLYSDAVLQAFFVLANVYGWVRWSAVRAEAGEVVVERLSARERVRWSGAIVAGTLVWGGAMARWTDAAFPWWDAAIAAASVAAQLLMAKRRIENWWLWVAIDVASIPLYLAKSLFLFAALYLVYLALAVGGLVAWRRAEAAPMRLAATV